MPIVDSQYGEYGAPFIRKTVVEVPVVYATGTRTTLARLRLEASSSGSNVSSELVQVIASNRNFANSGKLAVKIVDLNSLTDDRTSVQFAASLSSLANKGGSFYTSKPYLEVIVDTGSQSRTVSGIVKIELSSKLRWDQMALADSDNYIPLSLTGSGTNVYPAIP